MLYLNEDIQILQSLRSQWDIELKRLHPGEDDAQWSCHIKSLVHPHQTGYGYGSSALAAIYNAMEEAGVNFHLY